MHAETLLGPGDQPTQITGSLTQDEIRHQVAAHPDRVVYAKPQDLPSFPTVGVTTNGSAAGAAASLGWQNQKSAEIWKATNSATAAAAAMHAKDYKMTESWAPSPSAHGAQAALLAHSSAKNTSSWAPSPTADGQSAATQAFKGVDRNQSLSIQSPAFSLDRNRSLMAAKGAMCTRPRAKSASAQPATYPDEINAASNAIKAATKAQLGHGARGSGTISAIAPGTGAIPYTTMHRLMFTANPAVPDQARSDQIHASAVAMAQKMFSQQQLVIDATKKAHGQETSGPHLRRRSNSQSSGDEAPQAQLGTLQDKAIHLAQERLAKLDMDNQVRNYQEYYGSSRPQRRFSVMNKLRRRASSDGELSQDHQRSLQIREQMSVFTTKLSAVDCQKRQHDRESLLAAAQRNVQDSMRSMDEKISEKTGKAPPPHWESKAHEAAQLLSDKRMSKHGQVDIGAGKFMTREEVDAIARSKVQPVLDDLDQKAEKERARRMEQKLESQAHRETAELEKAREHEVEEILKKLREREKAEAKERKAKDKEETKANHPSPKKRLSLIPGRKSAPTEARDSEVEQSGGIVGGKDAVAPNDSGAPVKLPSESPQAPTRPPDIAIPDNRTEGDEQRPKSGSTSPTDKVKSWFKNRFSRRLSRSGLDGSSKKTAPAKFIGGAALTGAENGSSMSEDNRSTSVRAVALAGTDVSDPSAARKADANGISPLGSSTGDDESSRDEGRKSTEAADLLSPVALRDPVFSSASHSPVRDSKFQEMM